MQYTRHGSDTSLLYQEQITYKEDTAISIRSMGLDNSKTDTSYAIPLERDSHGNITRLLSRINDHYELTIYTYTYY